jgi:hypothetical protein
MLVGAEILAALYFSSLGPPVLEPHPDDFFLRAPLLLDLAKALAVVNLIVVAGLWIESRSRLTRHADTGHRRIVCVVTAASLLLGPFVTLKIAQRSTPPTLALEQVLLRSESDSYRER